MNLSPWHGAVLSTAAVLSAPATWAAFVDGTLPVADAFTRFLLCVALSWVAINAALPLLVPTRTLEPALVTSGEAVTEPVAAEGS